MLLGNQFLKGLVGSGLVLLCVVVKQAGSVSSLPSPFLFFRSNLVARVRWSTG